MDGAFPFKKEMFLSTKLVTENNPVIVISVYYRIKVIYFFDVYEDVELHTGNYIMRKYILRVRRRLH